jgi:isopropylmalate/homocitrate/citramalate synthase
MKIYESYEDLPKLKLPYGNEVFISDSTIRDGSQMPGIVLSREHKVQIYEYLHEIGIEKLEAFVFNKETEMLLSLCSTGDTSALKLRDGQGFKGGHR